MSTVPVEGQTEQAPVHGPYLSPDERMRQPGAHVMGPPADPKVHMGYPMAATWTVADHQQYSQQNPYIQYSPDVTARNNHNPFQSFTSEFNKWTKKADSTSRNIWHNLRLGPSVSETAYGKINLTAKALNEGGFEKLFRRSFTTSPNEKLKKWFACYLSTTTGPVSGTLYLSTARVAFCSDRVLFYKAHSGHGARTYYKVMIPLASIVKVNHPVIMPENPSERYIQIITVDGYDFWFMGFVSFEKATQHLLKIKNEPPSYAHTYHPQAHASNNFGVL